MRSYYVAVVPRMVFAGKELGEQGGVRQAAKAKQSWVYCGGRKLVRAPGGVFDLQEFK